MESAAALKVAIDLISIPSRVRKMRSHPLPEGVAVLLRIAAGDQEAAQEAAVWTGRSPAALREAAVFFVEQILMAPDADSYRVLGARATATTEELRRNMALLLKGMHPDRKNGDRVLFARRVTGAWNALKTPERRASYDAAQDRSGGNGAFSTWKGPRRRTGKPRLNQRGDGPILTKDSARALGLCRPAPNGLLGRVFRYFFAGGRS